MWLQQMSSRLCAGATTQTAKLWLKFLKYDFSPGQVAGFLNKYHTRWLDFTNAVLSFIPALRSGRNNRKRIEVIRKCIQYAYLRYDMIRAVHQNRVFTSCATCTTDMFSQNHPFVQFLMQPPQRCPRCGHDVVYFVPISMPSKQAKQARQEVTKKEALVQLQ